MCTVACSKWWVFGWEWIKEVCKHIFFHSGTGVFSLTTHWDNVGGTHGMRMPFAFIFRVGQREVLCCPPSLASMISAECEYNLVCDSSRKTLSMLRAAQKIKCWLWLRPSSWSSVSTGDKRCEEEKPCDGWSQKSCCCLSINGMGNWFCWAFRTACASENVIHIFFQDPVQVSAGSPSYF